MQNAMGFYLLLDIGLSLDGWLPSNKPQTIQIDVPCLGVMARSIYLMKTTSEISRTVPQQSDGRFAFSLSEGQRDDPYAQRLADALVASYQLVEHMIMLEPHESPLALWLPYSVLSQDICVPVDAVVGNWKDDYLLAWRLQRSIMVGAQAADAAWRILPVIVRQPYLDAAVFFYASIREFGFVGDGVTEVLRKDMRSPGSRFGQVHAENAVINAFKAVEAIVGEPPTDDDKFKRKLRLVGVDPDEAVGYLEKEPIIDVLKRMRAVRDKRAAHGRSAKDRTVRYYEVMEAQECARYVLLTTIEQAAGLMNVEGKVMIHRIGQPSP